MTDTHETHRILLVGPNTVAARERCEVVFEAIIGAEGLATGGGLRLYPPITTPPHFWSMVRWSLGLATVEDVPEGADLDCRLERHDRGMYHETKAELIHVENRGRPLVAGETFRIVLSDTRAQALAMSEAPFYAEFDAQAIGDSYYVSTNLRPADDPVGWQTKMARLRAGTPASVRVVGAEPARLVMNLPSKPGPDGRFWLSIRAEDKYGNVAEMPAGKLTLKPSAPGLSVPAEIECTGGPLCMRYDDFGTVERPGSYWIDVCDPAGEIVGTSNVITTELQTAVQFGDIHGHTFSSDGLGTQEEYFHYARDIRFAELTCLTDHALFDDGIIALSERFNQPGRFVTLFGRELGDHRGHRNVYGTDAEAVRAVDGRDVIELAQGRDLVVIPHHTNASTKNYWGPCDLSYHDEELQRLIEVSQNRGSFEVEQIGGPVVDGGYGSSVQSALARGMKLGFVGGSDTHRGTPSGPSHPLDPYYNTWNGISGLSCIVTDDLSREAVFAAMKQRLTYSSTGPRFVAEYFANDAPMGSILEAVDAVKIEGFVGGSDRIDGLEIVKNNEVVHRIEPRERIVRLQYEEQAPGACYYYIRAWQRDGHYVYLSPIWLGL